MHIKIDPENQQPAYMQIYSAIRNKIISGALPCGMRLPSRREMAGDCGVSIITVEHAYHMLCDEDFCEMRPRSGCYVKYDLRSSFPSAELTPAKGTAIPEPAYHNDNIPFSAVAAQLRKTILDYGERILMKSPNNGCAELREAICRYLSRSRNIEVSPDQIIIGSGAEYLYGLCIQMLGREKIIALEDPSYQKIQEVYAANGAICEMLPMDSEGILTEALHHAAASVLHITPFNSYPSHITASEQRRNFYIAWAKSRNAVIIEDDYDSEFVLTGTAPQTLFSQWPEGNVIYLNTFSRTVMPSIRVGYMLLPKKLLPLYTEKIGFYSCTVPMLEQYFLAEWINCGEFERNINRIRRKGNSGHL